MNWWIKFGCMLTGWDKEVLSQCSVASRKQLNKYTSAMLILILIWGVTGFCFAQRYIGLPTWGCALTSLFFITIVVMIERQIILTLNKSTGLLLFRGGIAVVMALIGSTIIDQTMFGKDIDKQMTYNIEKQVAEVVPSRIKGIEANLVNIRKEKDSINVANAEMQKDINGHPFIITKSVRYVTETKIVNGEPKTITKPVVETKEVPNPKIDQVEANNKKLDVLSQKEDEWMLKKQTIEEDVRSELGASC